jgi:hypothetical protein
LSRKRCFDDRNESVKNLIQKTATETVLAIVIHEVPKLLLSSSGGSTSKVHMVRRPLSSCIPVP